MINSTPVKATSFGGVIDSCLNLEGHMKVRTSLRVLERFLKLNLFQVPQLGHEVEPTIEPAMEGGAGQHEAPKSTDNNSGSQIDSPATKITDFELIKKLGEGTFGQVYLAVHKRTGSRHAVKIIEKRNMNVEGLESMLEEQHIQRDITKTHAGQFCLPLDASFHDSHYLYMVSVSNCRFL